MATYLALESLGHQKVASAAESPADTETLSVLLCAIADGDQAQIGVGCTLLSHAHPREGRISPGAWVASHIVLDWEEFNLLTHSFSSFTAGSDL